MSQDRLWPCGHRDDFAFSSECEGKPLDSFERRSEERLFWLQEKEWGKEKGEEAL